ncbi:Receptor-like protein EIX2 [Sesamum alatum]|uniref:Receptor-like protein EIX2 n=1 Tax=Sesamum alatum TaxID=300844 RepID=A0AAE2CR53_9LAMI|nr:Receptor-like protein EIX2 [Sesamum alatum]
MLESYPVSDFYYSISPVSFQSAYFMWKGKEVKYINHVGLVKLIDFSDNNLVGEIPSNITKLIGLVALNISGNKLTGPIPLDIGHLESLNFLDLSRNRLSGAVPADLGVLDLSYNNLSGRIPLSNHELIFDASSYVGNVNLCGKPLNKSCPEDESLQDPNSRVRDRNVMIKGESEDDRFITGGFYVALGLGFVVGFWSILGIILFNRRFRYAFFKQLDTIGDLVFVRIELNKARLMRYFQS